MMMEKILPFFISVILLIFLLASKIFSPIWLLFLSIFILWQYRRAREIKPLFFLSIFLFGAYIVIFYFSVLVPFIIGTGIAYIVAPLIDKLEQKKIPRILAILIVLIPLIAVAPIILFLLIINLINEVKILIENIPDLISRSRLILTGIINSLSAAGITLNQEIILNTINNYLSSLLSGALKTILQIVESAKGLFFLLYNFILVPIVTYILLIDREKISLWLKNLLSEERETLEIFIKKLNLSLARYFRGQVIMMIIVGFIIGFSLYLLGIRNYVFLGIVAAICNLIPNVGFILSLIIAVLVGLLTPPPLLTLIKILIVYLGEQLLENFFLGPFIIGKSARLNPIVVLLALILGGSIAGFWGLLLAIPTIIFLREFLNHFFNLKL